MEADESERVSEQEHDPQRETREYEAPRLVRLGSLAEITESGGPFNRRDAGGARRDVSA